MHMLAGGRLKPRRTTNGCDVEALWTWTENDVMFVQQNWIWIFTALNRLGETPSALKDRGCTIVADIICNTRFPFLIL